MMRRSYVNPEKIDELLEDAADAAADVFPEVGIPLTSGEIARLNDLLREILVSRGRLGGPGTVQLFESRERRKRRAT